MTRLRTQQLSIQLADKRLCADLTISINKGEVWGILGPNGCGKTTFLHTLAGLRKHTQGDLFLNEKKLTTLSLKAIARRLGILFQDFSASFSQTVAEYCLAGRYPHLNGFKKVTQQDQEIAWKALNSVALTHLMHRKIDQLSGGEKRRLAIATLLTQMPDIYLLDEPCNHLDLRHQVKILQHFSTLARRDSAAIIMTMHDINLAQQWCDKILLFYPQGHCLHGNTQDLLTKENLSRLYDHEIECIRQDGKRYWFPG